ncbi:hypothetical protein DY000_02060047 [Brassica cretica]|uniref:Uncharacterized protein n=1 Tax=Brassica cretica TaxID=69181 RepID=A0ABQ7AQS5_BRACR|nr:hypothetical protein DY000_02060047 [Brassica cretica]
MSSKRKSSTKFNRDRFVPEGSSSQHVGNVSKVEFSAESIDPEEVDAWRTAMGEVKPPTPIVWVPPSFKLNPHLVGILVLSYELGIILDADHLEAWVEPRWSRSLIVQVRPRTNMAIISGFVLKYHFGKDHFSSPVLATPWWKRAPSPSLELDGGDKRYSKLRMSIISDFDDI